MTPDAHTAANASSDPTAGRMLPILYGEDQPVCLLGPTPADAPLAVEPFLTLDRAHGARRSLIGGLCDAEQRLVEPLEFCLQAEPPAGGPEALESKMLARGAPVGAGDLPGLEAVTAVCQRLGALPVLLYCRKRNLLFAARGADRRELAEVSSVDAAVAAQQEFLRGLDPQADPAVAGRHPCVACPEQSRCYPADDGFAYAAERLALVNADRAGASAGPVGEWRLAEAAAWLGGASLDNLRAASLGVFDDWRRRRLSELGSGRPRLLLPGGDPRALAECVRLKLGLFADVLAQLEACWERSGRPHLCWNADTVRVAARAVSQTPAAAWGLKAILRKAGWQGVWPSRADVRMAPAAPERGAAGAERARPWPPAFSEPELLPTVVREAGLFFGQPRMAQVHVKAAQPQAGGARVTVLLEDLGWSRRLFTPADLLELTGDGWRAWVAPLAEHDPDDGEGLAAAGEADGAVALLSAGATLGAVKVHWWACFGEAVDTAVLGRLMLEALLVNDGRTPAEWRSSLRGALDELEAACAAVEPDQRAALGRAWLARRSADDSPASLWSRRNVLYLAGDRAAARLNGLPAALWQATVGLAVRMATLTPGFSVCGDRSQSMPRWGAESLVRQELRGLLAAYDDLLFGRRPAETRG